MNLGLKNNLRGNTKEEPILYLERLFDGLYMNWSSNGPRIPSTKDPLPSEDCELQEE